MGGIHGLLARDGAPVSPAALATIGAAMSSWGPDGAGAHVEACIGLGHLALHVTPESRHERLPIAHPGRPDLWITADARVDNRAELLAELEITAQDAMAIGDALLILLAYARWGEACPARLLGDFAFAIWDGERQTLFCARDPMGCRPFYYAQTAELFVFASDLRGVLAHPAVARRINEPLLALYLQRQSQHAEKRLTLFDAVVKLPAGHALTVTTDRVREHCYWSVHDIRALPRADDATYEAELRRLFGEAVDCRLRSAFPIGAHLSGGLDSTAVTLHAAGRLRAEGRELSAAYSWSPPPPAGDGVPDDERARVAQACAMAGIDCHYLEWDVDHFLEVYRHDIWTAPRYLLRELRIQRMARQSGIRVLLSGWGGDEGISFNGRGHLAALLLGGALKRLAAELAARTAGRRGTARRLASILYRELLLPILPDAALPLLGEGIQLLPLDPRYVVPAFARQQRRAAERLRGPLLRPRPGVHATQRRMFEFGHLSERCESWAISGAQHGIEYRYPLLDRRLVEFALAVPPDQYVRGGQGRDLFRRALAASLPVQRAGDHYKHEPANVASIARNRHEATPAMLDNFGAPNPMDGSAYVDVAKVMDALRSGGLKGGDRALLDRALAIWRFEFETNNGRM